jgi:hypothetical protein
VRHISASDGNGKRKGKRTDREGEEGDEMVNGEMGRKGEGRRDGWEGGRMGERGEKMVVV